jgi:hypothetical protein
MRTKLFLFALTLCSSTLFAQQQEETLFRKDRLRGGFGGPIFSYSQSNGRTGYGAGGGGGLVFQRMFVGVFGMGETFDTPKVGQDQLAIGYGGLWLGYVVPSHKLLHLYASAKIGGGGIGYTDFEDRWDFDDDWNDAVLVAVPEAGLELNLTRWFRMSGSVGYRFVNGFEGNALVGKNDLNAPVFNLTMRFGWFGGGRRAVQN